MSKISIVVPFHNEEKSVKITILAISSFLKRHRLDGEIIAVNDRSTDNTGKYLKILQKSVTKLRIIDRKGDYSDVQIGYA